MTDPVKKLRALAEPELTELVTITQEHSERTDSVIVLLGALCDSNDKICDYKEEQKQGDITSRKRQEAHNKNSSTLNMISIYIALTALLISVTGIDYIVNGFSNGFL